MRNLKLLTKESFIQLKERKFLFIFYLLFLILSFGVIVGLAHFTFSFETLGSNAVSTPKLATVQISNNGHNYNALKRDSNTYYSYLKSKNLTDDEIKQVVENYNIVPENSNSVALQNLYKETEPYSHGSFAKWVFDVAFKDFKNPEFPNNENFLEFRGLLLKDGNFNNDKIRISNFQVYQNSTNTSDANPNNYLYPWQIADPRMVKMEIIDSVSGFSLDNFSPNSKEIIVSPSFLKFHKLKLGDMIDVSYKDIAFSNLKITATGLLPQYSLSNVSDMIYFNPFLYNDVYHKYPAEFGVDMNILSPNTPTKSNDKINAFFASQANAAKQVLLKSFTQEETDIIVHQKFVKETPLGSLNTQVTLYNLFTWIVALILIILLLVSYRFIQSLIIRSNKNVLVNLKAMGMNDFELGYYLSIIFLPILIIGSCLGLLLAWLIFVMLGNTLGYSVGFVLGHNPSSNWGYAIFGVLVIIILLVSFFLALWSLSGNNLSINNRTKISHFEMWLLKIKEWKIFNNNGFGNIVYSFQVTNLVKAFAAFIISILSFTMINVSLQFSGAINHSLNDKPNVYEKKGESISYRSYNEGKIENTNNRIEDLTPFVSLEQVINANNGDISGGISTWFKDVKKQVGDTPIYNFYFDEVYYLDNLYQINQEDFDSVLPFIPNGKQLIQGLKDLHKQLELYKGNFGTNAQQPNILFKNRVKDKNFLSYAEIHNSTISSIDSEENNYRTSVTTYNDINLTVDEVIISDSISSSLKVNKGDFIDLNFEKNSHVTSNKLKLKVKNIDQKLYMGDQVIVNFDAIRKANDKTYEVMKDYNNGVVSKGKIPYDLQYFVLAKEHNDGNKFSDYLPTDSNTSLLANINFMSLPLAKNAVESKTKPFANFASLITVFLVLVSVCVLCVISMLIAYENKKNILVLKTLGYNRKEVVLIFTTIYFIFIVIAFIGAIFIAGSVIDATTTLMIKNVGLPITHLYNAITIIPSFLVATVFYLMIVWVILSSYHKANVKDITFAE